MDDHLRQLVAGLANPAAAELRNRRFVEGFVRPRGIDRPVAPIMVEEIEKAGRIRKRPRRPAVWHYPARRALLTFLTMRTAR